MYVIYIFVVVGVIHFASTSSVHPLCQHNGIPCYISVIVFLSLVFFLSSPLLSFLSRSRSLSHGYQGTYKYIYFSYKYDWMNMRPYMCYMLCALCCMHAYTQTHTYLYSFIKNASWTGDMFSFLTPANLWFAMYQIGMRVTLQLCIPLPLVSHTHTHF